MLRTVTEREFKDLLIEKEFAQEERRLLALDAYVSLHANWAKKLDSTAVSVLGYLISRTLNEGRLASRIPFSEFTAGTTLSKSTVRRVLSDLSIAQFVTIYRTVANENGHEKESRMFEIDCKNIQKTAPIPGSQRHPPVPQGHPSTYINYIDSVEVKTETSLCTPRLRRGSNVAGVSKMFNIPKKPRPARTSPELESALEVVSRVQGLSRVVAAKRVASAGAKPAHMIDKLELQALIDKAMKRYHPDGVRVMVTGMAFGALRKRLKESPPQNFPDFIDFTIRMWHNTSIQNANALRKKLGQEGSKVQSAMGPAPDFAVLAYRYPYFLKVYANREANRVAVVEEDKPKEDVRLSAMAKRLEQAENDKRVLLRQLATARKAPVRRTRVEPISSVLDVEFGDSAELPAWQTKNTFGGKRK